MHRAGSKNKIWTNAEPNSKTNPSEDVAEDPNLPGNRWNQLQIAREEERAHAIANKLMPDPNVRYRLDEAITIVGTCEDMCPEVERHEREAKALLDPWEYVGGPHSKDKPKRVDHQRAVRCYQRGSGDSAIPSDLRTPEACLRTTNYLFGLLEEHGLPSTHAFIRDRTRAVRLDLRVQQIEDELAMVITGRCVRFHILSLHTLRELPKDKFDSGAEVEQIGQTLQTLKQFPPPYSVEDHPEFMAYYILFHIRNEPPSENPKGETSRVLQFVRAFWEEVKKASPPFARRSELRSSPECGELLIKFADDMITSPEALEGLEELGRSDNWRRSVVYLITCLVEFHFGDGCVPQMEEYRGGLSDRNIIECDASLSAANNPPVSTNSMVSLNPEAKSFVSNFNIHGAAQNISNGFSSGSGYNAFSPTPSNNPFTTTFSAIPAPTGFNAFSTPTNQLVSNTSGTVASNISTTQPTAPPFARPTSAFSTTTPAFAASSGPAAPSFGIASNAAAAPRTSAFQSVPNGQSQPSSIFGKSNMAPANAFAFGGGNPGFGSGTAFGGSFKTATFNAQTPPETIEKENKQPQALYQPPHQPPFFQAPTTHPVVGSATLPFPLVPPAPPPSEPRPGPTLPLTFAHTNAATEGVPSASTSLPTFPQFISSKSQTPQEIHPPPGAIPQPSGSGFSTVSNENFEAVRPSTIHPAVDIPVAPTPDRLSKPALTTLHPASPLVKTPPQPPLPKPDVKEWATELARERFDHMFQVAFASVLAETLAKESYERTVRRQLASCFHRWMKGAADRCEKKIERLDRERKREEDWRAQNQDSASGRKSNGIKRHRMSSVISPSTSPGTNDGITRNVKRRTGGSLLKGSAEIGDEVKKRAEAQQRHWLPGTFLKVIKTEVERQRVARGRSGLPPDWSVVLSVNHYSAISAGWLRLKFGLPEDVGQEDTGPLDIGLDDVDVNGDHPGLIIFECAPIPPSVSADERLRLLNEDSSRLRNIILTLSQDRHYLTQLIIITWVNEPTDTKKTTLPIPILATMEKFGFNDYRVVAFEDDPSQAFEDAISNTMFDVTGTLVRNLSVSELFNCLLDPWKTAVDDAVSRCRGIGEYNWDAAGYTIRAFVDELNSLSQKVTQTIGNQAKIHYDSPILPVFDATRCASSSTSLDYMIQYCEEIANVDMSAIWDEAGVLRKKSSEVDGNETVLILNFCGALGQVVKDASESRALRHAISLGRTQPLQIDIVRTRLDQLVLANREELRKTLVDLNAVRKSLAAAHWIILDSAPATIPPSSTRSLSDKAPSSPEDSHNLIPTDLDLPSFGNRSQAPLTLEDLRPPTPAQVLTNSSSLLSHTTPLRGSNGFTPYSTSQNMRSIRSAVTAGDLRSKAREVLARYKGQSAAGQPLQSSAQYSPSSSTNSRNGISPPRHRYDPLGRTSNGPSKATVLAKHANSLRQSLRGSVSDREDSGVF